MSTLDTLQDILIKEFGLERDQLGPDAELSTLGVDSLDMLDLMFKIEDRYRLTIHDELPANLGTVQDLVTFIDGLLARRRDAGGSDGGADVHAAL